jgi:uncharacterized protein (TIGR02147 family)
MPNIFNYFDYREYLRDFYSEAKARNKYFSYQLMADKAGFKSKSFIKLVIDGKKNLSQDSLPKINQVLKLNEKAFAYFDDLVSYNHAQSLKMRNYFFERLFAYRKRNPARLVLQKQFDFYAKWYHNTLRELVTFYQFKNNFQALAKTVQPAISARQARDSVRLLTKLKLIRKTRGGYVQTDPLITTGDEVASLAIQNFHIQNMVIAAESIDTCPASERDISCLVLGLSKKGFEAVKAETQAFRKKLLQIANEDTPVERVYHLNVQLFPTSRKPE